MSQLCKVKHSRQQWKHKAKDRGEQNRYYRKQIVRLRAERTQARQALKVAQARLAQMEGQWQQIVLRPKVDVVYLALQLFLVARIGFRAVARVLSLLAGFLGIDKPPCAQSVINWVLRLSLVRLEAARSLRGSPLPQAPFRNGLIWMLDLSIGLGAGKMLAVLAFDAQHHRLLGALSLAHVHCLGVAVAPSWSGEAIADILDRLIARLGRPVAYLKDGGSELQKAAELLDARGLGSPCLDDLSHAVAGMLKRVYGEHPAFSTFLAACGRVSAKLKQTLLASLAPPKVRTKARFLGVHRLFKWADALLKLSPPGGAKKNSMWARLRACLDQLPACKDLIRRFRADCQALLACQKILKHQGLSLSSRAQCEPWIDTMASARLRQEFCAYLDYELDTARHLGLEHLGLPISSDAIESLFGVAKRHGVGETPDVARMALRLPAFCGVPTREEAQQMLGISVAQQRAMTEQVVSLTKQRRRVLGHPEHLESLSVDHASAYLELLAGSKKRSNFQEILSISNACGSEKGPREGPQIGLHLLEPVGERSRL